MSISLMLLRNFLLLFDNVKSFIKGWTFETKNGMKHNYANDILATKIICLPTSSTGLDQMGRTITSIVGGLWAMALWIWIILNKGLGSLMGSTVQPPTFDIFPCTGTYQKKLKKSNDMFPCAGRHQKFAFDITAMVSMWLEMIELMLFIKGKRAWNGWKWRVLRIR